jgi:hypothetical protein
MERDVVGSMKVLAAGGITFPRYSDADLWTDALVRENRGKVRCTPEQELEIWEHFRKLCERVSPKCTFNKDGIASGTERRRRMTMCALFGAVDFRSRDEDLGEVFRSAFGGATISWMVTYCGKNIPPWYYEWAWRAIPDIDGKIWGPKALQKLEGSEEHLAVFRELEPLKKNHLLVKRIMMR